MLNLRLGEVLGLQAFLVLEEEVLVTEELDGVDALLINILKVLFGKLVSIAVDLTLSWLINFGGFLLRGNFDVFSNLSSFDRLDIQNEAEELRKCGCRLLDDIFISNNMDGDVLVEPPHVELLPHGDLLLDELGPGGGESLEIFVCHGAVMGARADHVK